MIKSPVSRKNWPCCHKHNISHSKIPKKLTILTIASHNDHAVDNSKYQLTINREMCHFCLKLKMKSRVSAHSQQKIPFPSPSNSLISVHLIDMQYAQITCQSISWRLYRVISRLLTQSTVYLYAMNQQQFDRLSLSHTPSKISSSFIYQNIIVSRDIWNVHNWLLQKNREWTTTTTEKTVKRIFSRKWICLNGYYETNNAHTQ